MMIARRKAMSHRPAPGVGGKARDFRLLIPPPGKCVLYMFSVIVLVFVVAPVVMVVLTSLNAAGRVSFPPDGFTFQWYRTIPGSLWAAGLRSMLLAGMTASAAVLLGVPAALGMYRANFRGKSLLETGLRTPLTMPQVVTGVAIFQAYILVQGAGFNLVGTLPGLLVGHVVIATPFVITTVVAGLLKTDPRIVEAAEGLGATPVQAFWRITLPMLRPSILAAAFFAFLISFQNVPVSLFLGGAGASTLPVELFFAAQFSLSPQLFAAASVLIVVAGFATLIWYRTGGLRSSSL
ncbi:ABC transporter permease [Egibacter rhizosphaerae]|uniref:ABC transporter permease n=1 Tax=Egibacter rhizosphaerae TaxID=1670831 RepID=A0A411YHG3_9ACTN|nr:ABC transporter permease [Egibacter rhizosphaerae]